MANTFHNQGAMDRARRDYNDFLEKSNVCPPLPERVFSSSLREPSFSEESEEDEMLTEWLTEWWCRTQVLPEEESMLNAELMEDKEALPRVLEAELTQEAERFKVAKEKHKKMALRGVVAPAGAGVVATAGRWLVRVAGVWLSAAAGFWLFADLPAGITEVRHDIAADAEHFVAAVAERFAAAGARITAVAHAVRVIAARAGLIIAVGVGVVAAVWAIFRYYN